MINLIAIRVKFNSALSDKVLFSKIKNVENKTIFVNNSFDIFSENKNSIFLISNGELHERILYINFDETKKVYDIYTKLITELKNSITFDFDHYLKVYFTHSAINDMRYLKLNKIKMVLNLDEQSLYSKMPLTRKSPFTQHINSIEYIDFDTLTTDFDKIDNQKFIFNNTKYDLVDFTECSNNLIVLNFSVQTECLQIKDVIQYIDKVDKLINETYNNTFYTDEDKKKLTRIYKINRNVYDTLNTYKGFSQRYSNVKLIYNMKNIDNEKYELIKNRLIPLVIESNITNGMINYDSDIDSFELNKCNVKFGTFKNLNLFECDIQYGNFDTCFIYNSKIEDSVITNSKTRRATCINCITDNSYIDFTSKLEKTFLTGRMNICNGELKNCTVNGGSLNSKVQKNTKINNLG